MIRHRHLSKVTHRVPAAPPRNPPDGSHAHLSCRRKTISHPCGPSEHYGREQGRSGAKSQDRGHCHIGDHAAGASRVITATASTTGVAGAHGAAGRLIGQLLDASSDGRGVRRQVRSVNCDSSSSGGVEASASEDDCVGAECWSRAGERA